MRENLSPISSFEACRSSRQRSNGAQGLEQSHDESEARALARLGLKVAFGDRGVHVSDYLEERRQRRIAQRLNVVAESVAESGVSPNALLERVEEDDDVAELLEEVLTAARGARYQPKLQYLGRCLAAALTTRDDAAIDTTRMRVFAVRELESVHVRLLVEVRQTQDRIAAAAPRLAFVHDATDRGASERALVEDAKRGRGGFPAAHFQAAMAVLVRNGLVAVEQEVEVELEIELDSEEQTADGTPSATSRPVYRMTGLGREILDELCAIADTAVRGPNPRRSI